MIRIEEFPGTLQAMVGSNPLPLPLPAEASKAIGFAMLADIRGHFQRSTAPDGRPWPKLKYPRVRGGNKPLLDTGVLRNSLHPVALPDGAAVVTNHPGAALHNSGGVVKPRKAKALAIPLTKDALMAGSPRRFKRKLSIHKTRRGTFLAERKGARFILHYRLVRRVKIPARWFLGLSSAGKESVGAVVVDLAARNWLRPISGASSGAR